MSSKASLLPPLKRYSRPIIPNNFLSDYKPASSLPNLDFLDPTAGTIVTLKRQNASPQNAYRDQALKQRREIFEWLDCENPKPMELLTRIGKCATPYAKLIQMACEELEFSHSPTRSQKIDELERESVVGSAKKEVLIAQQQSKFDRAKAVNTELLSAVEKVDRRLSKVNSKTEQLQHLVTLHGVDVPPTPKTAQDEIDKEVEAIESSRTGRVGQPLNDEILKQLWKEQTELEDQIQILEKKLTECQNKQLIALKEYVARKQKR